MDGDVAGRAGLPAISRQFGFPEHSAVIPRGRVGRFTAIGVLAVGTLAAIYGSALWSHARLARDPGAFQNDARGQITPFFRYEDSTLFQNDYAAGYHLACFPLGYRGLYTAAGLLGGASALSKALPYLLLAVTVGALALAAYRVGGLFAAWGAAALCLGSSEYLGRLAGGLPRAFAPPLLALVLVALAYGSVRLLVLCTWLGAGFYPVVAVMAGISLALLLLDPIAQDRGIAKSWALRKRIGVLAGVALVTLSIVLPVWMLSAKYGPLITPALAEEFPEAGPGGRLSAHNRHPYRTPVWQSVTVLSEALPGAGEPLTALGSWLRADSSGRRLRLGLYALFAFASAGWIRLALQRPEARRVLFLPAAALLGRSLAILALPALYLPSRYIRYAMPAVSIVVLMAGTIGLVPERLRARRPWLPGLVVAVFCAATLLFLGSRGSPDAGLGVRVDTADPLYKFVGALPADSLIAGWPSGVVDNVPYVARRKAFATLETHQPYHVRYTLEMRRRVDVLIDAYFATTPEPLVRLRREFGVTHLLIDLDMLGRRSATYFKPFDQRIDEAVARLGNQEPEVVRQLGNATVFQRGQMAVLDLTRIRD